ncbi:hypothetical protein RB195_015794 [Necator americanus]|uniref:SCP domain-containing protein n=1 Tax=Necator americanus TaxID=51031 RepID=A0ABR1E844_NECAM
MIFYTVILSVLFGIIGTAGQNTCPSTQNHVLNDVLRNLIVTRINDIRSQVAQGRFVSSSGVYARQASKMIRLAYGCDAELSAYNWAQQCFPYNSGTTTAETRYSYPGITTTNQTVLETAINAWRDEINSGILPQSSTERNIYQTYLGISNLAMMMWDSHQSVGCSVVPCTTFTQVICHFTPAGGAPGTQIYKPGPNCNRCSRIGMSTCSGSAGSSSLYSFFQSLEAFVRELLAKIQDTVFDPESFGKFVNADINDGFDSFTSVFVKRK